MRLKILTKAECVYCDEYKEVLNWDGELVCCECKIRLAARDVSEEYELAGLSHDDIVSAEVSALA